MLKNSAEREMTLNQSVVEPVTTLEKGKRIGAKALGKYCAMRSSILLLVAVSCGACLLGWALANGYGRLSVAAVALFLFLGLVKARLAWGIVSMLTFLIVLGDLRRVFIPLFGISGADPLLLVVPAAVGLLVASLIVSRRLDLDTPLAKGVMLLMVIMVVQVLNPKQGGLSVGLAGLLFYLVPLGWFWIGRTYATNKLASDILTLVVALAVPAALLVFIQVWFGFLPFEQAWIEQGGYTALWVGDRIRPFGFSTSSAECATLLSMALVIICALAISGRSRAWLLLLPVIATGLFLLGSRGPVVKVSFILALLWAVQGRTWRIWLPRFVVAGVVGVFAIYLGLTELQEVEISGPAQNMVSHQTDGLLNPLDEEHSTAGSHAKMMFKGMWSVFSEPLGYGTGATTIAAGKFGGTSKSSEIDWSNLGYSLGLPGLLLYGAIICLVLYRLVQLWQRDRSPVALAIFGFVVLTGGNWLTGGQYSTVALVWICIGIADQLAAQPRRPQNSPAPLCAA